MLELRARLLVPRVTVVRQQGEFFILGFEVLDTDVDADGVERRKSIVLPLIANSDMVAAAIRTECRLVNRLRMLRDRRWEVFYMAVPESTTVWYQEMLLSLSTMVC